MFSVWNGVAKKTQLSLLEEGIEIEFGPKDKKNVDHCYQCSVGNKIYFAFAKTNEDLWIELKLKPIKGEPQKELYEKLRANKANLHKKCGFPFVWDEEDRKRSNKDSERGTYRILVYVKSYRGSLSPLVKEQCVEMMVKFIKAFI